MQNHPGQREREQKLDNEHLAGTCDYRMRLPAADVAHEQTGKHGRGELGDEIGDELVGPHPPTEAYGGADCRIEVTARHVTTGEDHSPSGSSRSRAGPK